MVPRNVILWVVWYKYTRRKLSQKRKIKGESGKSYSLKIVICILKEKLRLITQLGPFSSKAPGVSAVRLCVYGVLE